MQSRISSIKQIKWLFNLIYTQNNCISLQTNHQPSRNEPPRLTDMAQNAVDRAPSRWNNEGKQIAIH